MVEELEALVIVIDSKGNKVYVDDPSIVPAPATFTVILPLDEFLITKTFPSGVNEFNGRVTVLPEPAASTK